MRKYRVVRLEDRSYYGYIPVTPWLDYNDAQVKLRYYNVKRVGKFDIQCQTLSATISLHSEGREKMALAIGDTIITTASGIVGTVLEIVPNATGSFRVRIAHDSGEKWTTVKP